ncbi:hypothetical protein [Kitasatospora sp. LaBMicrA B282]|uniref:hypothetical protein n=1 Tax=Kitasatospora sp. LaBMicrA B282 TaxID=3420949 RepID=UPI003D0E87AD
MDVIAKQPVARHDEALHHPDSRRAFRRITLLVRGYLLVSAATLAAIVVLRQHTAVVTPAVWVRCTIVLASALLTTALARRAARGSRGALRRLRIISTVMVTAIAVILALPGTFPLWFKVEQGGCGLLLLGVVVTANGRRFRSLLPRP